MTKKAQIEKQSYVKTNLRGYQVEIFLTYDGKQLFVSDKDNNTIYAHRLHPYQSALLRAEQVVCSLEAK